MRKTLKKATEPNSGLEPSRGAWKSVKYSGVFPFQKAPSESHPIKISFHCANHFVKLNKGNARLSVGRDGALLGLIPSRHRAETVTTTLIDLARRPPSFLLAKS